MARRSASFAKRYGDLTSHACEYLVLDVRRQEQVDVTDSVLGIMARAMWRAGAAGLGSPFH